MEGQQVAGSSSQSLPLAIGLDGSSLLSSLMSSVASDSQNSVLNFLDIPLSFANTNGFQQTVNNITLSSAEDLLVSSVNLPLNGLSDLAMYKMSDTHFLNNDLGGGGEAKSPLSVLVTSDSLGGAGPSSPLITSQPNMSNLPFQSVVSGGDKMLSAVNTLNLNDPEILGDSAFDSNPTTGLPQFDDGLLSSLGGAGQGMRLGDGTSGTPFNLFDDGVGESLSLSPQPFPDTGLMSESPSVLDTGLIPSQSSDLLDNNVRIPQPSNKKTVPTTTAAPDLTASTSPKFGVSQCNVCAKTFSNIGALAKHKLTHSDERKYVCNVCSKGFKRQDHLNGHLMTHLDKKPFECQLSGCDKGYCDARSLRRHLEQYHQLDPDTAQSHAQASMAAAGIPPPAGRSSAKNKSGDSRGKQLSSPVYSPGSATPTPSPGSAGAGNVFHFDAQQLKSSQQQKQQQELLVQQIHQREKMLLQQQKQQQQQQQQQKAQQDEQKVQIRHSPQQMQIQLQQQQQMQQRQQQQQQQQHQPADMLAVIQQVQQLQQQQHKMEGQKKGATGKDSGSAAQQDVVAWADKAAVYTFVGTPTSNEHSPASRSDQSPSGLVVPVELAAKSPVSPANIQQPPTSRPVWYGSPPETSTAPAPKTEEPPKAQAYCSTCDRYFKNSSALNGHMRCHGGFLKKPGKDKDGKKSPMRKSTAQSDMGPPLRRPPHTSTPSPQPGMARSSPTMMGGSFSPSALAPLTPTQTSVESPSGIELLNTTSTTDQLTQNPQFSVEAKLPQQKHRQLQEQLSSHILKRRISGEQQQRRQQQQQQQQQQQLQQQQQQNQQNQQFQQIQSNQEQMRLLEEHFTVQQQQQQQQQQQNIQLLSGQVVSTVPSSMGMDMGITKPASPQQGEHIQRLVQSFQQVEELHRQQQELPELSAEQLEQIRLQHKLLGLPPLNPKQLQFQLQEQHQQLMQQQLREQQIQQQQNLQPMDAGTLVMTTTSSLGQVSQVTTSVGSQPVGSGGAGVLQLNGPTSSDSGLEARAAASLPPQALQHILAGLDPSVVTAAGISVADQQQLLAQLQKQPQQQQQQQQQQPEMVGLQMQSQGGAITFSSQPTTLVSGLQVGGLPQILLQPPDADDLSGVPTISIPEAVVLGGDSGDQQQQLQRLHSGLMDGTSLDPSVTAVLAGGGGDALAQTQLGSGQQLQQSSNSNMSGFMGLHNPSAQHLEALPSQPQLSFTQLRENITQGSNSTRINSSNNNTTINSSSTSIQGDASSFLGGSTSRSSQMAKSSSPSSAASQSTDAAVAQILRNISHSLAASAAGNVLDTTIGNLTLDTGTSSAAASSAVTMDTSEMGVHRGSNSLSVDNSLDLQPSFQSYQSYSPSFNKPFKDSIKQDVMLSSAVTSDGNNLSSLSSDILARDDVPCAPKPAKIPKTEVGSKRRLSEDLDRKGSSLSSLHRAQTLGVNPNSVLVSPLEVEGLSPGRVRVRSKSGDLNSYKALRSKSVDHSPGRTLSLSEDPLYRGGRRWDETFVRDGKGSHPDHDLFSRSDGAGVFRNPGHLPSPLKIKRKHRPAPLYIPPQFGIFQSRLRSPRVIGKDGHLTAERGKGHTPPPYTPPPMLSPFRSGSGLFCTLSSAPPLTPKSAPEWGKISISRRGSSQSSAKLEIAEEPFSAQSAEAPQPPPETDTEAHINIGPEYQAVLPALRDKSEALVRSPVDYQINKLWDPSSELDSSDAQLQCYQEFSCTAAVKGNGCNVEYALHLLHLNKGDISEAMLMLMGDPPVLPATHPMVNYKYQESDTWNSNEMELFYKSIMVHDKDFFKVAGDVVTKSVKQCVQFYYVWKKVCPDDYRRLRLARNKQGDYNTRRQAERVAAAAAAVAAEKAVMQQQYHHQQSGTGESQAAHPVAVKMEVTEEAADGADSDNTSGVSENDDSHVTAEMSHTAPSTASSTPTHMGSPSPLPAAPAFHCTYKGCSVTFTSKHNLKRHMRKHQEKAAAAAAAAQNAPVSTPPRKPRPSTPSRSPVYDEFGEEIFPCRLCGRVFAKVKSRSAHMKSHKIAEQAQQERKANEISTVTFGSA